MQPYYQDECKTCACGCGQSVNHKRKFVSGHNLRVIPRTDEYKEKIGAGQKRAWSTKRKRKPVGSTNFDVHGYVRVKTVEGQGRWEKQHILVIEGLIGRKLHKGEHVHHINGVRQDNRPENLYLCRDSVHHKQVEQTLVIVARQLLEQGVIGFDTVAGEYYLP